jgi:hypothetical protein
MQHLINKWIIQNKTEGREVVAQCCFMVKIQCPEPGETKTQLWSKGQGQVREED